MNARRLLIVLLPVLAGLAVIALWPKEIHSPEDEVRTLVAHLADAAGRKDVSEIAESLDESFKGGALSRQETKQMLAGMLLRSPQGVAVLNPSLEVKIESPTSATIDGTFVFAQSGNDIGKYDIRARLVKTGDDWRFISAEWQR